MWDRLSIMGIFYWAYCIAAILVMVNVVLKNRDSVKTLAWVMVLLFLPFLGILLYFFFGRDTRKAKLIGRRLHSQIKQHDYRMSVSQGGGDIPLEYSSLVSFFDNSAASYMLNADSVKVISSGSYFAEQLLTELEKARHHIHVQFYIVEDDEFGRAFRDVLIKKAKEGVEVRLIYDSVGCWSVKKRFYEEMRCAGIYVESFLKVRFPLFTNKMNYRNHRKIVVIDGMTGFVGGYNIADRYVKGVAWGVWRDTMLLVRGAAVQGLQSSFLVDWYFANRSLVSGALYYPQKEYAAGGVKLQVVPSNPVGEIRTIMGGLVKLLSVSRNYVYLQTPYLMPNESFMQALKNAAVSGVDVRLMVPEKSDNRFTDYATKSYFGDLLNAGVKIYLYNRGFLHSKSVVCDDYVSSVGSANLDFRSFFYNFEVTAFVYDKSVAHELKRCFIEDISNSRQLTIGEFRARSLWQRCLESVARLFSPLL